MKYRSLIKVLSLIVILHSATLCVTTNPFTCFVMDITMIKRMRKFSSDSRSHMKAGDYIESICNDSFCENCMPIPYVCFKSQSMQAYTAMKFKQNLDMYIYTFDSAIFMFLKSCLISRLLKYNRKFFTPPSRVFYFINVSH